MTQTLTLAVPKGRILKELTPLLAKVGIEPEPAFFDEADRSLQFATNRPDLNLIRVRSFDVATFVAFGAAQLGVVGSDVLDESAYDALYAPVDLGIGKCRLSLAAMQETETPNPWPSHVRVATKYPNLTRQFFATKGVQAECVKLNGAMELAPKVGLSDYIVDLVSSGNTLKANGLKEVETMVHVTSQLVVQRSAYKLYYEQLRPLIDAFAAAVQ